VSSYHFSRNGEKSGVSFRRFVKRIHAQGFGEERAVTPQAKFLFDERRYRLVNFVGRFENLDEDFAKVCDKLGLGPQSLPHENAARARRPYRDYYNAQTRALVETLYREDIERFGFTF